MLGQPVQIGSPLNALSRAMQVQGQQQDNALRGMQMRDMQQQRAGQANQQQELAQFVAGLPPLPADAPPRIKAAEAAMRRGLLHPVKYLEMLDGGETEKPMSVPAGGSVYQGGKIVATAPEKTQAPKASPLAELLAERDALPQGDPRRAVYDARIAKDTTHAPAASTVTYAAPVPFQLADGTIGYAQPGNRAGAQPQVMKGPDGKPLAKPADGATKELTEGQAKATALLGQMRSASGELDKLGGAASTLSQQAEVALAGGPANIAISEKAQQINQARMQWAEAFLRFKTGAASTPAEVKANVETFFPKIGDKPGNIAQKARMREQAEKDMEIAAGRGAEKLAKRGTAPGGVVNFADLK